MILVFGGTTEGKLVVETLEEANLSYIYTTKTKVDFNPQTWGTYRFGPFDEQSLLDFCKANFIKVIIHASHPFAEELHKTIETVANELGLPVLRFERTFPERIQNPNIYYLSNYQEAISSLLENKINRLLALTGVQTIGKLHSFWTSNTTFFRILPRETSIKIAQEAGFPRENLILQMPSESVEEEVTLIKSLLVDGILTKESGESGFLSTKIKAALERKIPIFIIEKPAIPASFIQVHNKEELLSKLESILQ